MSIRVMVLSLVLFGVLVAASVNAPNSIKIYVSIFSILIVGLMLLALFASVIFKGVEGGWDAIRIIFLSASGIATLPIHFAVAYLIAGISKNNQPVTDLWTAIYFSVVTWTTLGYGDVLPTSAAQPLVILETALGYTLMALLIAVFVRAMDRQ